MRKSRFAGISGAVVVSGVLGIIGVAQLKVSGPDVDARFAANNGVFSVYLSPNGSDSNSGLSSNSPVQTLRRAQAVLQAAQPVTDVEVRIKQGTYVDKATTWTFLVPGHRVSFLPSDYSYGKGIDAIAGRPVFRGDGSSGYWFKARLPTASPGGTANLRFYYLQVENYDFGALDISGGYETVDGLVRPHTAGHNGNTIFGMIFTRIGNGWGGGHVGYAGLSLLNSRYNLIKNNHFLMLANNGADANLMHGLYFAHSSTNNIVRGNRFKTISGDPVRVRNDSNDNDITGNGFSRTGSRALLSDWFSNSGDECPSHGNLFHGNNGGSGYAGQAIRDWYLFKGDNFYTGPRGCSNGGESRIRSWDNT